MRRHIIFSLVLFLASCTSYIPPTATSSIQPSSSGTVIPTAFTTEIFTPSPIIVNTPSTQPVIVPTITVDSQRNSGLEITKAFLCGVVADGDRFGSGSGRDSFLVLHEPQDGYAKLRLTLQYSHSLRDQFTSSQISSLTSGWRIFIFRYRVDHIYSNQPALIFNNLQVKTDSAHHNITADLSPKDIQDQFGDYRAFTFQVFDEAHNLKWQGRFSLAPSNAVPINWDEIKDNFVDGIIMGYPHSRLENETAFVRQDKAITIIEPRDGFYLLYYMFDFSTVTGITATSEQEALAKELNIDLFSYRDDGEYSSETPKELRGEVVSVAGVSYVYLPIEWLKKTNNYTQPLYLRITDGDGNIIKEDFIQYIPYVY